MKVEISREMLTMRIIFYEVDQRGRITLYNLYTGKGQTLDESGAFTVPSEFVMQVPEHLGRDFLKAMAEALDKEGVKTENDFKVAGLLEATKYHLEDMREIVKIFIEPKITLPSQEPKS